MSSLQEYERLERLGEGAGGTVDAGRHLPTGRLVALKELSQALRLDDDFRQRFRQEAALLREIDHPAVVRLLDLIEDRETVVLVLELVAGAPLRRLLDTGPAVSEAALFVLRDSLLGLEQAHALGIVHRDYKPDNVLVDDEGHSHLIDLGIAVRRGEAGWRAGTPAYMAPEQWAAGEATPATDIYAVAAVLFECCTGQVPFTESEPIALRLAHEHAPIPDGALPGSLCTLLRRGMAKRAEDRFASAGAFLEALEEVAGGDFGPGWMERGRQALRPGAAAALAALPIATVLSTLGGAGGVAGVATVLDIVDGVVGRLPRGGLPASPPASPGSAIPASGSAGSRPLARPAPRASIGAWPHPGIAGGVVPGADPFAPGAGGAAGDPPAGDSPASTARAGGVAGAGGAAADSGGAPSTGGHGGPPGAPWPAGDGGPRAGGAGRAVPPGGAGAHASPPHLPPHPAPRPGHPRPSVVVARGPSPASPPGAPPTTPHPPPPHPPHGPAPGAPGGPGQGGGPGSAGDPGEAGQEGEAGGAGGRGASIRALAGAVVAGDVAVHGIGQPLKVEHWTVPLEHRSSTIPVRPPRRVPDPDPGRVPDPYDPGRTTVGFIPDPLRLPDPDPVAPPQTGQSTIPADPRSGRGLLVGLGVVGIVAILVGGLRLFSVFPFNATPSARTAGSPSPGAGGAPAVAQATPTPVPTPTPFAVARDPAVALTEALAPLESNPTSLTFHQHQDFTNGSVTYSTEIAETTARDPAVLYGTQTSGDNTSGFVELANGTTCNMTASGTRVFTGAAPLTNRVIDPVFRLHQLTGASFGPVGPAPLSPGRPDLVTITGTEPAPPGFPPGVSFQVLTATVYIDPTNGTLVEAVETTQFTQAVGGKTATVRQVQTTYGLVFNGPVSPPKCP